MQKDCIRALDRSGEAQLVFLKRLMAMTKLDVKQRIHVEDELVEKFFERLATFEIDNVLRNLKRYQCYRIMVILDICKKKNAELAVAYLSERLG